MLERILKIFTVCLFFIVGFVVFSTYVTPFVHPFVNGAFFHDSIFGTTILNLFTMIIGGILFGLIAFVIAPFCIRRITSMTEQGASKLSNVPTIDILLTALGMVIGLMLANLIGEPLSRIPLIGRYIPVLISILLGITGAKVALLKKKEIISMTANLLPRGMFADKAGKAFSSMGVDRQAAKDSRAACSYKVLDTSVIIDGRIADICKTGFLEGALVVPKFVLEELQKIADSSDTLKRNRGRRGLDILNEMQKDNAMEIQITDTDFEELHEVDAKLVRLAQTIGGAIVTNDFNLNKVAELQGVRVLNINLLANMVKPMVLPGEEMYVHIAKEGKEAGQGVAYLEDGTMIVVEGARKYVGEDLIVIVTTALQTAAGRMIFAKLK